jgi:hypothetical protein
MLREVHSISEVGTRSPCLFRKMFLWFAVSLDPITPREIQRFFNPHDSFCRGDTQELKRDTNPDTNSSSSGTTNDECVSNFREVPSDLGNINLCPKALSTDDCRG